MVKTVKLTFINRLSIVSWLLLREWKRRESSYAAIPFYCLLTSSTQASTGEGRSPVFHVFLLSLDFFFYLLIPLQAFSSMKLSIVSWLLPFSVLPLELLQKPFSPFYCLLTSSETSREVRETGESPTFYCLLTSSSWRSSEGDIGCTKCSFYCLLTSSSLNRRFSPSLLPLFFLSIVSWLLPEACGSCMERRNL